MAEFIDRRNQKDALKDSRADKFASYELADFEIPSGREEEWRFTPVSVLGPVLAEQLEGTQPTVSVAETVISGAAEFEFVPGVSVKQIDKTAFGAAKIGAPTDRVAAVSWNNAPSVLEVKVGAGVTVEKPLIINIDGNDRQGAAHYIYVEVGAGAKAEIVLKHTGEMALAQTVEVSIGDESQVKMVSLQEASNDSLHCATHRMQVGANAEFKHSVITIGGKAVRIIPELEFAGEHAEVELLGLYITDTGQHHEHRLFVHHNLPNCKSNVTYKGALHGTDCHGVWIGDVLIGPNADGTDSYEQNRNLVLNLGPKVDSVPNLEIANGNIEGAGHASATMRFDEEQLFYLRSRGISEAQARRLVVHGFFAELVGQIGIAAIEEELLEKIAAELERGLR